MMVKCMQVIIQIYLVIKSFELFLQALLYLCFLQFLLYLSQYFYSQELTYKACKNINIINILDSSTDNTPRIAFIGIQQFQYKNAQQLQQLSQPKIIKIQSKQYYASFQLSIQQQQKKISHFMTKEQICQISSYLTC
ncbi:glycosyltransferase family 2 protein (macronuclear) [Tetrahymena thermophila SB210]|uniref:Glycosyltransferase family 2 protein n=1 Tax=Tetrahymena thermophila (strain SB210) TaxID=312017 RepID=W7X8F2_TETTS|nr:glycosyltransferase family 2 protein [Tetrahymena thermophila SB210]EWS72688.1 glycosyltransferase family 2 protein [Tetrahymena thermophila SB210]|eukprot:XP_012654764.1 glycosyltransferase family 2 protein [Tetrahymena thermophila SB210]